jgi:hypothetical protein
VEKFNKIMTKKPLRGMYLNAPLTLRATHAPHPTATHSRLRTEYHPKAHNELKSADATRFTHCAYYKPELLTTGIMASPLSTRRPVESDLPYHGMIPYL